MDKSQLVVYSVSVAYSTALVLLLYPYIAGADPSQLAYIQGVVSYGFRVTPQDTRPIDISYLFYLALIPVYYVWHSYIFMLIFQFIFVTMGIVPLSLLAFSRNMGTREVLALDLLYLTTMTVFTSDLTVFSLSYFFPTLFLISVYLKGLGYPRSSMLFLAASMTTGTIPLIVTAMYSYYTYIYRFYRRLPRDYYLVAVMFALFLLMLTAIYYNFNLHYIFNGAFGHSDINASILYVTGGEFLSVGVALTILASMVLSPRGAAVLLVPIVLSIVSLRSGLSYYLFTSVPILLGLLCSAALSLGGRGREGAVAVLS
ncbi:hypothetical protein GCM10007108_00970 [Thermogymnomonas acidicola]|uniref:Uncharacterized protein n=1 Tax=Thermogymnomonas acidicola TaxID=399579 RepID=A0AA37BQ89_9ARCH|nr:hypothetical protein [Thermogymnomonas acidicola]GGM66588.1 hypothetical protein GCM10007108_00970 [Thermogymnomonas acidicola]